MLDLSELDETAIVHLAQFIGNDEPLVHLEENHAGGDTDGKLTKRGPIATPPINAMPIVVAPADPAAAPIADVSTPDGTSTVSSPSR